MEGKNLNRLEGKIIIVTGGASGIGLANAQILAAEGAKAVIADLDEPRGHNAEHLAAPLGATRYEIATRPKPTDSLDSMLAAENVSLRKFTRSDAFDLGVLAVALIRERSLSLAVEVAIGTEVVFRANLSSAGTELAPWLNAKANVARRHGVSSLLAKRRREEEGAPVKDFIPAPGGSLAYYGGSIPLRVQDAVVGTITTSGEEEDVDHQVALDAAHVFIAAQETTM
jgi:uncharacterized protein (UPF0303 family)